MGEGVEPERCDGVCDLAAALPLQLQQCISVSARVSEA